MNCFLMVFLYALCNLLNLIRAQFDTTSTLHDWVLRGHVHQTLNLTTIANCLMMCSNTWNCYSINFYPSNGICELNKAINASNPADLQYHVNGAYLLNLYRRMPCNDSACASGGPNSRCFYKNNGISEECIGCSTPLGLGDGTIPDSSFKSSSSYMVSHDIAFLARLNLQTNWATYARPNEWVQVDLSKVLVVTKIATQGSYWSNLKYVKTYFIYHALDGENWESYKENGKQKLFSGNTDGNTIVTNTFKEKILTRFVRLVTHTYSQLNALRMELYGCQQE